VQHMDVVLGQDAGTKEACLSALSAKGYAPGHVLMVGDALGDLAAAQHADALFYPILVGKEKTSWERLVSEALPRFLAGTFAGAYQEQLLAEQREILK
ncbi:MAG: HAD hydrolase-like protein, partial [Ruthenibacterium sp.]|nr:HAD hydrolase-like protein [Ruthenibacterium sp.]